MNIQFSFKLLSIDEQYQKIQSFRTSQEIIANNKLTGNFALVFKTKNNQPFILIIESGIETIQKKYSDLKRNFLKRVELFDVLFRYDTPEFNDEGANSKVTKAEYKASVFKSLFEYFSINDDGFAIYIKGFYTLINEEIKGDQIEGYLFNDYQLNENMLNLNESIEQSLNGENQLQTSFTGLNMHYFSLLHFKLPKAFDEGEERSDIFSLLTNISGGGVDLIERFKIIIDTPNFLNYLKNETMLAFSLEGYGSALNDFYTSYINGVYKNVFEDDDLIAYIEEVEKNQYVLDFLKAYEQILEYSAFDKYINIFKYIDDLNTYDFSKIKSNNNIM